MMYSDSLRRVALCFGAVALLLGAASCGEDDATSSTTEDNASGNTDAVSAELDGAGGELTHTDGAALVVPEGALSAATTISVAKADAAGLAGPPSGWTVVGDVFEFTPHGQTFGVAATVRLPFSGDASRARVVRLADASDTSWEEVAGATFQNGQATFLTTSFSFYAVAEGDGASENNSTSNNSTTSTNNGTTSTNNGTTSTNNASTSTNSGTTEPDNNASTQPDEPDPEPASKPGG